MGLEISRIRNEVGLTLVKLFPGSQIGLDVLFVFDECGTLVDLAPDVGDSQFVILRRAMRCLGHLASNEAAKTFCLVLDTTSRISNLAPVMYLDPSERARAVAVELFHPIYALNVIDVWPLPENLTLKVTAHPECFTRFGRAAFYALYHSGRMPIDFLLAMLEEKIQGSRSPKFVIANEPPEMKQTRYLAILSHVVALHVKAESHQAVRLV
jgi:hypothetical protein